MENNNFFDQGTKTLLAGLNQIVSGLPKMVEEAKKKLSPEEVKKMNDELIKRKATEQFANLSKELNKIRRGL